MKCDLCQQEIELEDVYRAWRQVAGWVTPAGGKSMTGAEQTGKHAHEECIVRLRSGFDPKQVSLV